MEKCAYGCQQEATTKLKGGKWCCADTYRKCPAVKLKISSRMSGRTLTQEHRRRMSDSIKMVWQKTPEIYPSGEEHSRNVGQTTKGKFKNPTSIWQVSSRTREKIVKRLKLVCSIPSCGWNKGQCDIHHINGRKGKDADDHTNLTCVCPNCHRLIHEGKIGKEQLVTLDQQVGSDWVKAYYG